ncbi:type IX secretion system plug protein [Myroides sp. LJL119]
MTHRFYAIVLTILGTMLSFAQVPQNTTADYIKTASFMCQGQSCNPFFRLGDTFSFEFDDLYADDTNYFYRVLAYNYDWTPSDLKPIQYIKGMENQRIMHSENSYNTLQNYTHYKLNLPNSVYQITKSGNYVLEIYDQDNQVVIRRKFILYEDVVNVGVAVKRTRDLQVYETKQNLDFTISLGDNLLTNPTANIKVAILQNGRWDSFKTGIKPQYTIGNDLIYRYEEPTQFWGLNQFLNFDNSDIRQINNFIGSTTVSGGIYNTYLYTNYSRKDKGYTYFPDIHGQFVVRNINARNPSIEAEYAWVYFTYIPSEDMPKNTHYYIGGMFNDYQLNNNSKMDYNPEKNYYEKAILIKQGFTNYAYIGVENNKVSAKNNPDGNYALTQNTYQVVVYYRKNTDLYDRVLAIGYADAKNITY